MTAKQTAKCLKQNEKRSIELQKNYNEFKTLCKPLRMWLKKHYPIRDDVKIIIDKANGIVVEPIFIEGHHKSFLNLKNIKRLTK